MEEFQTRALRRPETLRWLVLAAIAVVLLMTVAFAARASAEDPLVAALNIPVALALLWFGWSLLNARSSHLYFDGERLTDDAGVEICSLDEIEAVEKGFALFKPSNGFAILLKERKPRGWSPGLWWRVGRRVGVGGATPGRGAKAMADAITVALAMRKGGFGDGRL